ncbi:Sgn1 protein [Starmerella bacillaris]|uniref:Sgn1 protein n=1 Tax=Starmerella bacillaris TaxID=1247836 RepID=A0AAV5RKC2_STABA|nr:Sgn1 protein [Starmerella bacillaris]
MDTEDKNTIQEDASSTLSEQLKKLQEEQKQLEDLTAQVAQNEEERHENKEDVDARSIYVGNVDYGATVDELDKIFRVAGAINRINIMINKFSGHSKGFAYIEFAEAPMVAEALLLNGTTFRDREIKVLPKRTNLPGITRGRGRGRGRARGRGYRGGYRDSYHSSPY